VSSQQLEYADVVVVGGGPAGSTVASLTAMQGHRVIILEKERFPRHQIGESLLPSTIHGICKLIGVYDEVEKAGFTEKRGGSFRWGANPETWTFSFSVSPKMAASSSFAYQVERSKFDKILLDHARRLGAEVRENCTVTSVIEDDDDRVSGISYRTADGRTRQIAARYVVDASGNQSKIYRSIGGSRQYSEFFRGVAVYGYFEGGKRLPSPNSGNILSAAFESGWCWYIPLSQTLTSVGVVVRRELANRIQGDPERALLSLIAECPIVSDYLKGARRITEGDYGKIRVRRDYSYLNTRFWRPGMALIGDAACFIDPVFSSGVHLATYSALLLGRSINSVLAGIVDEETAFREFELRYQREFSVFYQYLMCFYDMHVDADSYFWSAKKITKSAGPDLEAFVDLVGGVASGELAFGGDNNIADRIKNQSQQFSESVDELVAGGQASMLPVFKSDVVSQVVVEGARIQAHAEFGEYATAESPMFEKGLIASSDGMFWKVAE
jgi:halogenation protein CepH